MPELPDLVYIRRRLVDDVVGVIIEDIMIKNPVVLRPVAAGEFADNIRGQKIHELLMHGPFLNCKLTDYDLVINFMLAGRFQYTNDIKKKPRHLCFTLSLDNGYVLNYIDNKNMGKVYLTLPDRYEKIPGYNDQGVPILSEEFTYKRFIQLIGKKRQQVRVFIMDQKQISSIGNAYADEILFAAGIHPKTPCNTLSDDDKKRLFDMMKHVMEAGIKAVADADQPIEVKVRDHMKVRNKKNEPCPVCGTTIRRATVYGHDTFFCPKCQKAPGNSSIPW